MRLDEIKVDPFAGEVTDKQFKRIMNMIKSRGLDTDRRSASIKNRIISRWQTGERKITKFEMDFEKLGLSLKSVIGEMGE